MPALSKSFSHSVLPVLLGVLILAATVASVWLGGGWVGLSCLVVLIAALSLGGWLGSSSLWQPLPSRLAGQVPTVPADALLQATLQSMREGVLVVDDKRRVIMANEAVERLFSDIESPLTGKPLTTLTRNPQLNQAFQTTLDRGTRSEIKIDTKIGDRRVFDLRVTPLRGSADEETLTSDTPQGAIGVFFDITQLERLEHVRQEFLSNVSHELRTPLTAMLTFVETLEEGAIDDTANNRRFLGIIRRNGERMRSLINDILELSAIEAGTISVEVQRVHLPSIVTDTFLALEAKASARQVGLVNAVSKDTYVYADPRRLEQMLTNLIDNAIKFNRAGGNVTIEHTRFHPPTNGGDRDRIAVTDTGDGIAPEHLERIFERFYRVDRARSRDMGGTGLGLAIVKHLAKMQDGEATVRSCLGQGTTFMIDFPASKK